MTHQPTEPAPNPDTVRTRSVSRRQVVIAAALVLVLLAGCAVAVSRTSWARCRFDTRRSTDSLRLTAAKDQVPEPVRPLAAAITTIPRVGDLTAVATPDSWFDVAAGTDGDVIIADAPAYPERNADSTSSVDPRTGTLRWRRGNPGQTAAPQRAGDAVLSFAAVRGHRYRLTMLDGTEGSIRGCVTAERFDDAGIGQAAATVSADGRIASIATPTGEGSGSAMAGYDVDTRGRLWATSTAETIGGLTSRGSTLVTDAFGDQDPRELAEVDESWWQREPDRSPVSIRGLDARSGERRWALPAETTEGPPDEVASTIPQRGRQSAAMTVVTKTLDRDDEVYSLVGLDPVDGRELWRATRHHLPDLGQYGDVLLEWDGKRLSGLSAITGERIWSRAFSGGASGPRPDSAQPWGEDVLFATSDGLLLLDPATGAIEQDIAIDGGSFLQVTATPGGLVGVYDDLDRSYIMLFPHE